MASAIAVHTGDCRRTSSRIVASLTARLRFSWRRPPGLARS
jgi:hypothetical protein